VKLHFAPSSHIRTRAPTYLAFYGLFIMGGEVRAILSLFNVGQLTGFAHIPHSSRSFEPQNTLSAS
jgi:hypothetical protein